LETTIIENQFTVGVNLCSREFTGLKTCKLNGRKGSVSETRQEITVRNKTLKVRNSRVFQGEINLGRNRSDPRGSAR
jgi:hypothetical protein